MANKNTNKYLDPIFKTNTNIFGFTKNKNTNTIIQAMNTNKNILKKK